MENAEALKNFENIDNAVLCAFSFGGFFKNTIRFLEDHGIAWTEDAQWKGRFKQG